MLTLLLVLPLTAACYDEPGKVRGQSSRGSSTAKPEVPRQRFVLATGDAFITSPALRAVRQRLKALGVAGSAASVAGDTVVVDVPGEKSEAVAEALRGGRVDVMAGDELLIRGESLGSARAEQGELVLVFRGTAKSALSRALGDKLELRVELDGTVVARFAPDAYDGVSSDEGLLAMKMDAERAKRLAKRLTGQALSHHTKLEQKATE